MQFSEENNRNDSVKTPFILICDILNATVDDISIINVELKELRERSSKLEEKNESLLRRLREALRGVRETDKVDVSTQSDILSVLDVGVNCMEKVECAHVALSTKNDIIEVFEHVDHESISIDYSVISPVSTGDMDDVDHLYMDSLAFRESIEPSIKDNDFKSYYLGDDINISIKTNENISKLSLINKDNISLPVAIVAKPLPSEIIVSQTADKKNTTINNKENPKSLLLNTRENIPEHQVKPVPIDNIVKSKAVKKSLNINDLIIKPLPTVNTKSYSISSPDIVTPDHLPVKTESVDKVSSSSLVNKKTKSILIDKNVVTPQKSAGCDKYSKSDMLFYLERYKINFLAFVQTNTNNAEEISGDCTDLIRSFSCESSVKKKSKRRRDSRSFKAKYDEKVGAIDTGDRCVDENNRDLYDDLEFHDTHFSNISKSGISF